MTTALAVPTPTRRPTPAPAPSEVAVYSGAASLSAAEAVVAGMRAAADAGIGGPITHPTVVGDHISALFTMGDLLQWARLLADPQVKWWPQHLPAEHAEYVEIEGVLDGHPWTLRPLVERCPTVDGNGNARRCKRCDELGRVGR